MQKPTKTKRIVDRGRIYITSSFNNTIITVTDEVGSALLVGSCGRYGFAGTRKSTPYAATVTVQQTLQKAINDHQLRTVTIYVKGIGPGREASLRTIKTLGLDIIKILDITPIPHNGVRPPKPRRG